MQKTKRTAMQLLAFVPLTLFCRASITQPVNKALISITEARTSGRLHTLSISTRTTQETLRILAVYRWNEWRPGLISLPDIGESKLALATRLPNTSSREPNFSTQSVARWELTFDERRGLAKETYVIACRVSDIHGSRNLGQELQDVRRILDQVNDPTPSQREKTIEDVLRALFEFDWEPVGYTQLSVSARRA